MTDPALYILGFASGALALKLLRGTRHRFDAWQIGRLRAELDRERAARRETELSRSKAVSRAWELGQERDRLAANLLTLTGAEDCRRADLERTPYERGMAERREWMKERTGEN